MSIRRLVLATALLGALAPARAFAGPGGPAPIPAAAPAGKPTPPTGATPVPTSVAAPPTPDALALAFADSVDDALTRAVASVQESSVTIFNSKKRPDGTLRRESGGSGTFVAWKGKGPYILTNDHVVRDADRLEVIAFDGGVYPAKLKDHVATYDIAILEFIGAPPKRYKAAKFGRSEALAEGQWVIATGNPFFLGTDGRCVATLGVISGLERFLKGESVTYADAIQHDAEVNSGNSGGALWNLSGEFVGINGMIKTRGDGSGAVATSTGASYSIPIHLISGYLDALMSDAVAACAGYLGIEVKLATDAKGKPIGLEVVEVLPDSPCRKGGKPDPKILVPQKGDLLVQTTLGGVTAKSYDLFAAADLTNAIAPYCAGTKVRLKALRAGKSFVWSGELGGAKK